MVRFRRMLCGGAFLVISMTACHNSESDVATVRIKNDLSHEITIALCGVSCNSIIDEAKVDPGRSIDENIQVPGHEDFVLTTKSVLGCLHVAYSGPGDGTITVAASSAQPVQDRADCK